MGYGHTTINHGWPYPKCPGTVSICRSRTHVGMGVKCVLRLSQVASWSNIYIYTYIYNIYIYIIYIYIYIVCVLCRCICGVFISFVLDLTAWNDCVMMWIPKTQSKRCTTCENWGQLWSTYHAVPILVEESWVQKSRSSDIKLFFSGETILVGGLEHGFYDFPYIGNNSE